MSYFVQVLYTGGIIAAESTHETKADMLAAIKAAASNPATEGETIRAITTDGEIAFKERSLHFWRNGERFRLEFGAHDWPLTFSRSFPDEMTLSCPRCGSTNWEMTGHHAPRGTGPGGRGRLGEPGGVDILRCNDCKHESRKRER